MPPARKPRPRRAKSVKTAAPARHSLADLITVMARLRDPDGGCPWDLAQNFETIAPYTIEEAYEVADAIARHDMNDLREELGDLLLQSVYHAQMASEIGAFDLQDVIHGVTAKMIARHPHVFGDGKAASPDDVNKIWDAKKEQEKGSQRTLDGVARALPALLRAYKLQKKAAKRGFRWKTTDDVFVKLDEEVNELRDAIQSGHRAHMAEELGDVLFVAVTLARHLDIDPEESLRQTNEKFIKRFNGMESDFNNLNQRMEDASLEQMLELWRRQKNK